MFDIPELDKAYWLFWSAVLYLMLILQYPPHFNFGF